MSRPVPASPTVSVIVVSLDMLARTRECLAAIPGAAGRLTHEVVVVDRGSRDGSVEMIANEFPHARVIEDADSAGPTAAISLAAREARGAFVLLLDAATIPGIGAIERLVQFARCCPDAQIWGGRILYADGSPDTSSCCGRMTLWSLASRAFGLTDVLPRSEIFNTEGYGAWARDEARRVDIVSSRFMLVRRTFWHELGGLDSRFPSVGADWDFCLRAARFGAAPMVMPEAEVIHYGRSEPPLRADRMIRQLAARVSLIRRHFPSAQRPIAIALLAAWPLTRTIAAAIAAIAAGRDDAKLRARTWQQIWLRRRTWLAGGERTATGTSASARRSALPAR